MGNRQLAGGVFTWLSIGRCALVALVVLPLMACGCKTVTPMKAGNSSAASPVTVFGQITPSELIPLRPSNDRDWVPQHAVLPEAQWNGAMATVRNIRNFEYVTDADFVVRYYDKAYNLKDLETVDFIVVPFPDAPLLAHTMMSFGFRGGDYLVASVEVRLEKGETYSPVLGAMRQYEIIYVLADERDVIRLRTEVRHHDVYVYRVKAKPAQVRELFVDVLDRVNQLREQPEFYDTLTNNCTTNIVAHVNRLAPNRVPYNVDVLLPGLSGKLAYDVGLLDNSVPFDELTRRSRINDLAHLYRDAPDFSQRIRR